MARQLKVYSMSVGREDMVIAAHSMAEVARITGRPISALRDYMSETGNAEQIATAMAQPLTPLYRAHGATHRNDPYVPRATDAR